MDKYINLVQGELIFSIAKLYDSKEKGTKIIRVNTPDEHESIARLWLDFIMRDNQIA